MEDRELGSTDAHDGGGDTATSGVEVGELARRVGYVMKQAQSLLRARMEEGLRPLGLTVSQYACLELLHQNPGLTNAELARAGFVTAQSMNGVVKGLQARG